MKSKIINNILKYIVEKYTEYKCDHDELIFVRNIYRDETSHRGRRSVWICNLCNKYIYKDYLFEEKFNDKVQNIVDYNDIVKEKGE